MNILGFWRSESTIKKKQKAEQKMETFQNKFWGGLQANILLEGIHGIVILSLLIQITSFFHPSTPGLLCNWLETPSIDAAAAPVTLTGS